jgi:ABC-type branched-subunit amino acid transport system ATPase component
MLDELSLGLAPPSTFCRSYGRSPTRQGRAAVLIVEPVVRLALEVADRCYVVWRGEVAFESSAAFGPSRSSALPSNSSGSGRRVPG